MLFRVIGRVEYTTDGVDALLDLAHGDMRRVINILQVVVKAFCHM